MQHIPKKKANVDTNKFSLKEFDEDVCKLFSNNKNEFFSLDIKRGNLNWKQKVNKVSVFRLFVRECVSFYFFH